MALNPSGTPAHIIEAFKVKGFNDISRSNFFEVDFTFGHENTNTFLSLTKNLIRSVQIPQILFGEIEIRRMNRTIALPGSVSYTPLIVNVYDEVTGKTRGYFQDWISKYMKDVKAGKFHNLNEVIKGTIDIYQLNGYNNRMTKTRLYRAFPKMIGEVDLNMESEDTLNSFNVSFGYSYYRYSNDFNKNFKELDKLNT